MAYLESDQFTVTAKDWLTELALNALRVTEDAYFHMTGADLKAAHSVIRSGLAVQIELYVLQVQ